MSQMSTNLILEKCRQGEKLSKAEIGHLLQEQEREEREAIFDLAREKRKCHFGNHVFLYGFVYFSTYCQNNCAFCYYRRENKKAPRYRKSKEEVVQTAVELAESGVHLIDLTTGDDPYYTKHPERLADLIHEVKEKTGRGIMVSPGVLDAHGLELIKEAGADWYALYQETHTDALFASLRLEQSYQKRMEAKRYAKKCGLLIEEGLLTGVGDQVEDLVWSLQNMEDLCASQVRIMSFVPQEGIPLKKKGRKDNNRELLMIAVMRILFPDLLIPASLDVEGLDGLYARLQAGANVVTSIIPPKKGYVGVANSRQDIDEGYRTVSGIAETLERCGLVSAGMEEYECWVRKRKCCHE